MRRVQDLRQRCRELGVTFQEMHFSRCVAGRRLIEALCEAETSADFMQTAVVMTHGVLASAISEYLRDNDNVYDLPSATLMEASRAELVDQMAWAETALAQLAVLPRGRPEAKYLGRIEALLAELPAALLTFQSRGTEAVVSGRRIGRLPFAESVLPRGFHHLEFRSSPLTAEADYPVRAKFHGINFLQEVQAADSTASLMFDAPDMPWEFFFDVSRHMWDESRHAMFGEQKLNSIGSSAAKEGLSGKAYAMRQTLAPLDRYAALTTQEADAFPGKHVGLKDALEHGDAMSAMAWSYDIADEAQHVRFGTKWLPVLVGKGGDPHSVEQVKADACNWRSSVLAKVYSPAGTNRKPDP
jgi:hypothetical protein